MILEDEDSSIDGRLTHSNFQGRHFVFIVV